MFADNHQNVGQLKVSNSALWCIECFIGPSSHFLGLLGNRTIRHRNIEMVQCKLLSHRYLLNMFHLFYSKNTSVTSVTSLTSVRFEEIIGGAIFFFLFEKTLSLSDQYCGPLPITTFTFTYTDSSITAMIFSGN